jgi:hypothetical protein
MAHEWSVLTNSTEHSFTEKLAVTQPDNKFPATYGTQQVHYRAQQVLSQVNRIAP